MCQIPNTNQPFTDPLNRVISRNRVNRTATVVELLIILVTFAAVVALATIPAKRYEKRTGKKLGRGASAAMMSVVNELFQPSAANAAIVLEEQKEQRTAIPSGEDKDFANKTITIVLPENSHRK